MTPLDGDMFGMGQSGDDLKNFIENHPISVFMRLNDESPQNKVYQKCLEQEVDNITDEFIATVGLEQVMILEAIFKIMEGMVEAAVFKGQEVDTTPLRIMRKIFDAVHKKVDKK